jgi:RNA polymerase sigma-70 factor, ECF subfamily
MQQLLSPQDAKLVERLRAGDEEAFMELIRGLNPSLLRVARMFVPTAALAEDVVQETWLAVLKGIDRFEGRSSLKTWIFRILVNRAQSRGAREQRTLPFSSLSAADPDEGGPTVDAYRFVSGDSPLAGYWSIPPSRFFELPEERLLAAETRGMVDLAISKLPCRQQEVIKLRDVEGWDAEEVCMSLGISAANQRVLLHRARARVRAALEAHFSELTQA